MIKVSKNMEKIKYIKPEIEQTFVEVPMLGDPSLPVVTPDDEEDSVDENGPFLGRRGYSVWDEEDEEDEEDYY